jgi:putative oxidoreductase
MLMSLYGTLNQYFEQRKDYGAIFLRLIIGWRLIDGTQDNIFSWERMLEFKNFLEQRQVLFPMLAAHVSVYAQFICGILFVVGAFIRCAAIIMIINFIAALIIAHIGTTFQQSFEALIILFGSFFFLFHGAGKFSIDNLIFRQNKN